MSLLNHHENHVAVEELVRTADVEIIPFKSATDKLALVPKGTTITVTTSAKLTLGRTLEFSIAAAKAGYRVVPHLAARLLTDQAHLQRFVGQLDTAGITDLYVIGGDAEEAVGSFDSAAAVLEALSTFDHGIRTIGVACYPEGHPLISNEKLTAALHREQPIADYMVSQMCFNPTAISSWVEQTRADGITLPLHLGLSAPMQVRKLAELSLKIGVGSSVRYLTKQHGFIGKALRGSSYRPEDLLYELGDTLSSPTANIQSLHLFTFNQVAATFEWQAALTNQAAGV